MLAPWRGQIATPSSHSKSAFAQRPVVVRAAVLKGDSTHHSGCRPPQRSPRLEDLHRARRQFLDGQTSSSATRLLEVEVAGRACPLLGEWRSLGLVQRELQRREPEQRALEPDRAEGMPISSSSSSRGSEATSVALRPCTSP